MTIATLETIDKESALIRVKDDVDPNHVLTELHSFFDRAFFDGFTRVVFDMSNIEFPSASLIAVIIGKTMDFRRKNGNIVISNLTETARNHFAMFTPLTFLTFEEDASLDDIDLEKIELTYQAS